MFALCFAGVFGAVFFCFLLIQFRQNGNVLTTARKGFSQVRRKRVSPGDFLHGLWGSEDDLLPLGLSSALGCFLAGYFLLGVPGGMLLALAGFCLLPRIYLTLKQRRRRASFRLQLPAIIEAMATVFQAGGNALTAIEEASRMARPPLREVFVQLRGDIKANTPLNDVLDRLVGMVDSLEVKMLADAIKSAGQVGPEASSRMLGIAAGFCGESVKLKRDIDAATSNIRYGFLISSLLPPVIGLIMSLCIPQYLEAFRSFQGHILIVLSLIWLLAGHIWVSAMIRSAGKEIGL
jgi:Flp pilus assembly protein TadB